MVSECDLDIQDIFYILESLVSINYFIILGRLLVYLTNERKRSKEKKVRRNRRGAAEVVQERPREDAEFVVNGLDNLEQKYSSCPVLVQLECSGDVGSYSNTG